MLLTEGEATDQVTRVRSARFSKDRLHSFQNKMLLVSLMEAEPADGWLGQSKETYIAHAVTTMMLELTRSQAKTVTQPPKPALDFAYVALLYSLKVVTILPSGHL